MKKVTVQNYRQDKYYPRVVRAVGKILCRTDVVESVEIFLEMGNLSRKNHDTWRCGQVPCLERVIEGNLWNQSEEKKRKVIEQVLLGQEI